MKSQEREKSEFNTMQIALMKAGLISSTDKKREGEDANRNETKENGNKELKQ